MSHTAQAGTSASTTTTPAISTLGANLIILGSCFLPSGAGTLSDSTGGNTWPTSPAGFVDNASANQRLAFWSITNPVVSASQTFTFTGEQFAALSVAAFSITSNPIIGFDQVSSADNETTATTFINCGNITPTNDSALLFTLLASFTPVVSSPALSLGSVLDFVPFNSGVTNGLAHGYYAQPTVATINEQWSWVTSSPAAALIGAWEVGQSGSLSTYSFDLLF